MFDDKLCSISEVTYSKVGGVNKRVMSTIYSNITCSYDRYKSTLGNSGYSENKDIPKYEVVIGIDKNLVRPNQMITLIDPVLGSIGEFIIGSVQSNPSLTGSIDCITLLCNEIQGQR